MFGFPCIFWCSSSTSDAENTRHFFFLKPFLKALMAAEFCMATRTSSAHTSQNIKPTQVPLIMKVSEEKPLTDTSVESYYLVHTDYNKQPGFGTEQQGCQNRNYWDYSSESWLGRAQHADTVHRYQNSPTPPQEKPIQENHPCPITP